MNSPWHTLIVICLDNDHISSKLNIWEPTYISGEKKNTVRQKQTSRNIEGGKCVFKPEENGQI